MYFGDLIGFHVINFDFSPAISILSWLEHLCLWNTSWTNYADLEKSGIFHLFEHIIQSHAFHGENSGNHHKCGWICNLLKSYIAGK